MPNHNDEVYAFFEKCKKDDPEKFREVCSKYPTISAKKLYKIKQREISKGLLGLQPDQNDRAEVINLYGFSDREGD